MLKVAFVAVFALAVSTAQATQPEPLAIIREQQQQLAGEIESGSLRLTPRVKTAIRKDQAQVAVLLEGKAALSDLTIEERALLDNALERINAHVVGTRRASEQRDVCRVERGTASKLHKLDCDTQQARDNDRQGARDFLEKQRICSGPGCG